MSAYNSLGGMHVMGKQSAHFPQMNTSAPEMMMDPYAPTIVQDLLSVSDLH